MFQKVGDWISDKSERFIRGEEGAQGSYYASNEAEQAYGKMRQESMEEPVERNEQPEATGHMPSVDPFERAGKDYGGRVPYRSQRDIAAEQQRQMREEPPHAYPPQAGMPPQGFGNPAAYGAPPQAQRPAAPMGYPQQANMPPQHGPQASPQPPRPQQNNVVPFPGMQRGPDGGVYAHTEYIVLLRSRNECKNVIEYIKSSASVFLNMEFIGSDSERQRCVDMLSGAAYTLGCQLNKISPRGIYLISSPSVFVVIDPAMQKMAAAPDAGAFARQNYEGTGYGLQRQTPAFARTAQENDASASRFGTPAQAAPAVNPNTQRRAPVSFGSVMAGNATGAYQPATAYRAEDAATGRYAAQQYQQ